MAKGGFMCIGYPDAIMNAHATLESIVKDAQRIGAEVAYIFHDQDEAEPHYHFIIMWKKAPIEWHNKECEFPDCEYYRNENRDCIKCKWLDAVAFMKMHGLKAPKKGTNISYDYNIARIKDIDAAINYLIHEPI